MNEREELLKNWDDIKLQIKNENNDISDVAFNTWINPLKIGNIINDTVQIIVPSEHAGDGTGVGIIKNKYSSLLKVTISEKMNKIYNVDFIGETPETERNETGFFSRKESVSSYNNMDYLSSDQRSNLNPRYTFDTFVVGSNNQLAVSAAKGVAENPGSEYNNPLFLYGGPGLGKTHLMHAIGSEIIKRDPSKIVRYVTSEEFTNQVIESIQNGSIQKLRVIYRTVDVLLLDDVQFIIGKDSTQNEFFNSFNELRNQNKHIILSSDRPPKDLDKLEERLRSRFEWGLTVDITPPDYETRMAILRQYAKQINFEVDDEVIQYIASNIISNIRELEGALKKLYAQRVSSNQVITVSVAEEAIKDIIKETEPKKVTPDLILEEVAKYYGTTKDTITSKKRTKEIVIPRQVSMYLCRELTDTSFDEIGKVMGGKDHSTVMHGHNMISSELSTNTSLRDDIEKLKKKIIPNQ